MATVVLSKAEQRVLKKLAEQHGVSVEEAVKMAIRKAGETGEKGKPCK